MPRPFARTASRATRVEGVSNSLAVVCGERRAHHVRRKRRLPSADATGGTSREKQRDPSRSELPHRRLPLRTIGSYTAFAVPQLERAFAAVAKCAMTLAIPARPRSTGRSGTSSCLPSSPTAIAPPIQNRMGSVRYWTRLGCPLTHFTLTWGVSGQAHSFAPVAGVSPAKRGEAQRSRERSDLDAPATGYTVTSERAPARSWLPLWSLSRSFILALRISFCVWIRSVSPSFACSLDGRITSHPVELGRGSDHNPSCSRASGSGWRGPSC